MLWTYIGFWIPTVPVNFKSRRPLLIWDIDGTLLEARGIGRQALNLTFSKLFHQNAAFDGLEFSGATDYDLIRQASATLTSTINVRVFLTAYLQYLADLLRESPLKPLSGVSHLIPRLSQLGWPMALGTGNIRGGAYLKLGAAGLSPYFPVGGFSEPGATRTDILHSARQHCGYDNDTAIVIGDTPLDIQAGQELGLAVIAVATGRFTRQDLLDANANQVIDRLGDVSEFLSLIRHLVEQKSL